MTKVKISHAKNALEKRTTRGTEGEERKFLSFFCGYWVMGCLTAEPGSKIGQSRARKEDRVGHEKISHKKPMATEYLLTCPSILYPLFSVICHLFSVLCSLFSIICTLYSVIYSLFSVLCSLFSVLCSLYSKFSSRPAFATDTKKNCPLQREVDSYRDISSLRLITSSCLR